MSKYQFLPLSEELFVKFKLEIFDNINLFENYERNLIFYCNNIINEIKKSEEKWLKECPYFYKTRAKELESILKRVSRVSFNSVLLERLSLVLTVFLKEYTLYCHRNNKNLEENIEEILSDFENNKYSLSNDASVHLFYIKNRLPIEIFNNYLGEEEFVNRYRDIESRIYDFNNLINEKIEEYESKIDEKENRVNELEGRLNKIKTAFNFVGLWDGFKKILKVKRRRQNFIVVFMFFLGGVMLVPAAMTLLWSIMPVIKPLFSLLEVKSVFWEYLSRISDYKFSWEKMIPVLGLEVILIYFFRVVLIEFKVSANTNYAT